MQQLKFCSRCFTVLEGSVCPTCTPGLVRKQEREGKRSNHDCFYNPTPYRVSFSEDLQNDIEREIGKYDMILLYNVIYDSDAECFVFDFLPNPRDLPFFVSSMEETKAICRYYEEMQEEGRKELEESNFYDNSIEFYYGE